MATGLFSFLKKGEMIVCILTGSQFFLTELVIFLREGYGFFLLCQKEEGWRKKKNKAEEIGGLRD